MALTALASSKRRSWVAAASLAGWTAACAAWAADEPSAFSWAEGVKNTRHNLTQAGIPGAFLMQMGRNDYREVCVYCHTPHGAATNIQAPLWNRTLSNATYTTYDSLGTASLQGNVTTPGPNSLTCLSCHDGTVAVDSIINMPGSGGYKASQQDTADTAFLDSWSGGPKAYRHQTLSNSSNSTSCLSCHDGSKEDAANFTVAVIGTKLTDDHPVGVEFGVAAGLNALTGTRRNLGWIDTNGDGTLGKNDLRVFSDGDSFRVECASCHDPHGVPDGNGQIMRSFLRMSNEGSQLCLTCHTN